MGWNKAKDNSGLGLEPVMTTREIAEVIGCSKQNVDWIIAAAIAKLQANDDARQLARDLAEHTRCTRSREVVP